MVYLPIFLSDIYESIIQAVLPSLRFYFGIALYNVAVGCFSVIPCALPEWEWASFGRDWASFD